MRAELVVADGEQPDPGGATALVGGLLLVVGTEGGNKAVDWDAGFVDPALVGAGVAEEADLLGGIGDEPGRDNAAVGVDLVHLLVVGGQFGLTTLEAAKNSKILGSGPDGDGTLLHGFAGIFDLGRADGMGE